MKVLRANQVKFRENSLRVVRPKQWNRLPPHIKNAKNLSVFKQLIKIWNVVLCKCNFCFLNLWFKYNTISFPYIKFAILFFHHLIFDTASYLIKTFSPNSTLHLFLYFQFWFNCLSCNLPKYSWCNVWND